MFDLGKYFVSDNDDPWRSVCVEAHTVYSLIPRQFHVEGTGNESTCDGIDSPPRISCHNQIYVQVPVDAYQYGIIGEIA